MFRAGPRAPRTPPVSPRSDAQHPRAHDKWHRLPRRQEARCAWPASAVHLSAETRDRAGDLQIFGLALSQLSYRGCWRSQAKLCHMHWHNLLESPPRVGKPHRPPLNYWTVSLQGLGGSNWCCCSAPCVCMSLLKVLRCDSVSAPCAVVARV